MASKKLTCVFILLLLLVGNRSKAANDTVTSAPSFLIHANKAFLLIRDNKLPYQGGSYTLIDPILKRQLIRPDADSSFLVTTQIIQALLETGMHTEALNISGELLEYYSSLSISSDEHEQKRARILIMIGAIYEETGIWDEAIDYYIKAKKICDSLDWKKGKAMISNNLGKVYVNKKDIDLARVLFEEAITINKEAKNKDELFNNYNNLAAYYFYKKDFDEALKCALLALEQIDRDKDPYLLAYIYDNIASLYLELKNYPLALSYLQLAKKIEETNSFKESLIGTYLKMSQVYHEANSEDSSNHYIDLSIKLSQSIKNPSVLSDVWENLYTIYGKKGRYKEAFYYFNKYNSIRDSLDAINNQQKLDRLRAIYEVEKKESELQQQLKINGLAIERQRIVIGSVVIVAILLLILLIFIIQKRKKERNINLILSRQKEELHRKEKEIMLQKENELKQDLDYKNRQLTSYTLQLIRNNEFASRIIKELQNILIEMNPRDTEKREHIKSILASFRQFVSAKDWEEFRLYFEEVHQSFYSNLSLRFPELTPNEKKLCAFLRLGLSNKEIASVTFRELRSIESARNRLRRKMNLDADVNLINFLWQF